MAAMASEECKVQENYLQRSGNILSCEVCIFKDTEVCECGREHGEV